MKMDDEKYQKQAGVAISIAPREKSAKLPRLPCHVPSRIMEACHPV